MNGRIVLPLALLGMVFYLLVLFQHILLPFILAATMAYVLNPFIIFFESRGMRRPRAVMLVYSVMLIVFVGLAYVGISAAIQGTSTAATEMPGYFHQIKDFVGRLEHLPWLQRLGMGGLMRAQISQEARNWVVGVIETAPTLIRLHILPLLEMALLIPFLTYFFMLDGPWFLERLVDFVPSRHVEMFLNILIEINHSFGNYLRSLLLQAFFMGILAGMGYWIIGLNYAVYIAIWVAISSMIPLVGPISAALAGAVIALFQWGTLTGLLKVLVIYVVIRSLDDWLLQPLILRRAVHIHPVMTVFARIAGAYLAGIWGLLFAVPVVCMLKVLLEVGWQWYRIEYGIRNKSFPPEALKIPIV